MKWFKHLSDASDDEFLSSIIDEFGLEGYGRWWLIVECVARQMDSSDKCSAEYSWIKWQSILKGKRNKLETFLERLGNKLEMNLKQNGNVLEIKIPKLLELRDNHTKNLQATKLKDCKQEVEVEVEVEVDNKRKKKGMFNATIFLADFCKDKQLISDWLAVRKNKKAANTKTAMERFIKQVVLSNLSCEQVLEICCEKSWSGFKASWLEKSSVNVVKTFNEQKLDNTKAAMSGFLASRGINTIPKEIEI